MCAMVTSGIASGDSDFHSSMLPFQAELGFDPLRRPPIDLPDRPLSAPPVLDPDGSNLFAFQAEPGFEMSRAWIDPPERPCSAPPFEKDPKLSPFGREQTPMSEQSVTGVGTPPPFPRFGSPQLTPLGHIMGGDDVPALLHPGAIRALDPIERPISAPPLDHDAMAALLQAGMPSLDIRCDESYNEFFQLHQEQNLNLPPPLDPSPDLMRAQARAPAPESPIPNHSAFFSDPRSPSPPWESAMANVLQHSALQTQTVAAVQAQQAQAAHFRQHLPLQMPMPQPLGMGFGSGMPCGATPLLKSPCAYPVVATAQLRDATLRDAALRDATLSFANHPALPMPPLPWQFSVPGSHPAGPPVATGLGSPPSPLLTRPSAALTEASTSSRRKGRGAHAAVNGDPNPAQSLQPLERLGLHPADAADKTANGDHEDLMSLPDRNEGATLRQRGDATAVVGSATCGSLGDGAHVDDARGSDADVAGERKAPARGGLKASFLEDVFASNAFVNNVYMIARDQAGCRMLQQTLDEGVPEITNAIFREVLNHCTELMMDPFGNYLFQKLVGMCNFRQLERVLDRVCGDMARVSLNMHGARAVQKLVDTVKSTPYVHRLISALGPSVVALTKDPNGNHVIQRCLEAPELHAFIFRAVANDVVDISSHRHGCRIVQRCVDAAQGRRNFLTEAICANALVLVQDPYGNYVVQHVLGLHDQQANKAVALRLMGSLSLLSRQKFSSNVVERCLQLCLPDERERLISELRDSGSLGELLRDVYGNYVIQSALSVATEAQLNGLLAQVGPVLSSLRTSGQGRRIAQKLEKKYPQLRGDAPRKGGVPVGPVIRIDALMSPPFTSLDTPANDVAPALKDTPPGRRRQKRSKR